MTKQQQISELTTFHKYLSQLSQHVADLRTLDEDSWQALTQEEQERMTREIVSVRNMLKHIKELYYEW